LIVATRPPPTCANCGADIPPKAHERTGWSEQGIYDGLDLPDETESPGTFVRHKKLPRFFWPAVALMLVLVMAASLLGIW
jgi:hypothetical protein